MADAQNQLDKFSYKFLKRDGDLGDRTIKHRHLGFDTITMASGIFDHVEVSSVQPTGVPFIVRAAEGQTGNLTEWQQADGTILNRVDKDGNIYASGVIFASGIWDTDGDTGIEVEQTPDDDILRFTTAGTEFLRFTPTQDIDPTSSGVVDLGTQALSFDEGYFNSLEAGTSFYAKDENVGTSSIDTLTIKDSVIPDASGSRSVGTQLLPFQQVNAQIVRGDTGYFTTIYADHDDLSKLNWAQAGHTIDANIIPTASGTQQIGTISTAFSTGVFDTLTAGYISASGSMDVRGTGTFNDVVIPTLFTDKTEPTGFVNRTATLSFDNATRVFTITGSHDIYLSGVKTTKGTGSITISDTTGTHWIYYNAAGILSESSTPNFSLPTIATVYYNTTIGFDKGLLGEERHGLKMDGDTHAYLHYTVGTRYESGLTGTFGNTTFSITAGKIDDEDIAHSISEATTCDIVYKDGAADFVWLENQTQYYYNAPSDLYYNNGNALTSAPANQYVAYWIFATNSTTRPIVSLMGQRVDTTIAAARENNKYESLTLGQLPFEEMKLLYRVILRNDATPYVETQDLRAISNLPAGTYIATQHNALTGLNWAQAGHTIDADIIPTASGTQDVGTAAVAFSEGHFDTLEAGTSIYSDGNITSTGTIEGTTLTDGTATITGGNITLANGGTIGTTSYGWLFDETNGDISTLADVGIGTATPSASLVVSNAGAEGMEFYKNVGGNSVQMQAYNRSGTAYSNQWYNAATHVFKITGTIKMTIDADGNVGINEATPGEKLTINGDFSHLKAVRKEDTTTIDEDDTLTEDTYLKLATTVPGLWTFHNTIFVTTTTNADFKFRYTFPASTTDAVIHYVVYVDNTVVKQGYSAKSSGNDYTTNVEIDYADAPSIDAIVVNGYALTTAAGNIALEWAQRVSHVDDTTVWARSFIKGELGDA